MQAALRRAAGQQAARAAADPPRVTLCGPHPYVRVEQQHALLAVEVVVALNGVERPLVGEDGSCIEPKNEAGLSGVQRTSRATGLPCLVTTYSTPRSRTRSINSRHRALKSAAATVSAVADGTFRAGRFLAMTSLYD